MDEVKVEERHRKEVRSMQATPEDVRIGMGIDVRGCKCVGGLPIPCERHIPVIAAIAATRIEGAAETEARVRREYEGILDRIDYTLRVPAAEYVPAIGDVFAIIDAVRAHEQAAEGGV